MPQWTLQDTAQIVIWHCTVIVYLHGRLHRIYPLPANEPPKGEGVCRGTGYTVHEMCTMWLNSAVGSQSQAPLSLLCLDTDMAHQLIPLILEFSSCT